MITDIGPHKFRLFAPFVMNIEIVLSGLDRTLCLCSSCHMMICRCIKMSVLFSFNQSCLYITCDMIYVIHGNKITVIVIVIVNPRPKRRGEAFPAEWSKSSRCFCASKRDGISPRLSVARWNSSHACCITARRQESTRMWNMISSPATPTVCLEQKSENFQSRNVTLSMPSQSKNW